MDWKEEAVLLYRSGKKITDIAEELGKSRKTISNYINSLPELQEMNSVRKQQSKENRKQYKSQWKRNSVVEAAMLKRQHDIDVMVLSREQYFNE